MLIKLELSTNSLGLAPVTALDIPLGGSETFSTTAGMTHPITAPGREAVGQSCEKARPEVLNGGELPVGEKMYPVYNSRKSDAEGGRSWRETHQLPVL